MNKKKRASIVICKLPKAGLGNQLFPIMRAYTFAYLNDMPVKVYNYRQLKAGPWIRREKTKRKYRGFFNFEKSAVGELSDRIKAIKLLKGNPVAEPAIEKIPGSSEAQNYWFSVIPGYKDYFTGLQENRDLVLSLFRQLLSAKIRHRAGQLASPCIGVHIRMGDFMKAREGVPFGTVGHTRSPEEYFVEMIRSIRALHGGLLPVSVFTDGRRNEFKELFKLEKVFLVEGNNDLTDLLLLSKSKIIITSAGSTFSYWAAFLSEAIVIVHPTYAGLKIRPAQMSQILYEGAFDKNNAQLIKAIKEIQFEKSFQ